MSRPTSSLSLIKPSCFSGDPSWGLLVFALQDSSSFILGSCQEERSILEHFQKAIDASSLPTLSSIWSFPASYSLSVSLCHELRTSCSVWVFNHSQRAFNAFVRSNNIQHALRIDHKISCLMEREFIWRYYCLSADKFRRSLNDILTKSDFCYGRVRTRGFGSGLLKLKITEVPFNHLSYFCVAEIQFRMLTQSENNPSEKITCSWNFLSISCFFNSSAVGRPAAFCLWSNYIELIRTAQASYKITYHHLFYNTPRFSVKIW
jgi:hypothetical protein